MIDDDIETRLRAALLDHAAEAPAGSAMLGAVTAESRRRGRRSRLAVLSAGAAALLAIGAAVPFVLRGGADPAPAPVFAPPPSVAVEVLGPARVPASLVFPYALPPKYGEPRVMLTAGRLTASQELTDGISVTLTAYDTEPPVPSPAAKPTEVKVRGVVGTLYDWSVLVWAPDRGAWLSLQVEPGTVPAEELTAYADQVTSGGHKAQAPFTFTTMPTGWTVDNISPATVTFCPPDVAPSADFIDKIAVMLEESPGADGVEVQVGAVRGWLTESPEGMSLRVPQPDGHSLLLQVGTRARLPVDQLITFAAGIGVTPAAQVSRG